MQGAPNFELRSGLIQLLPKFHGSTGEDPHKHIINFIVVWSTMKPMDVPKEIFKMKAFPFSLQDAAKEWLFSQRVPITNWNDMKCKFLKRFFPTSKVSSVRNLIANMVVNYQQTYTRGSNSGKGVHEMQLNEMTDSIKTNFFFRNNMLLGNKVIELIELMR